jgi:hypothetical protein
MQRRASGCRFVNLLCGPFPTKQIQIIWRQRRTKFAKHAHVEAPGQVPGCTVRLAAAKITDDSQVTLHAWQCRHQFAKRLGPSALDHAQIT